MPCVILLRKTTPLVLILHLSLLGSVVAHIVLLELHLLSIVTLLVSPIRVQVLSLLSGLLVSWSVVAIVHLNRGLDIGIGLSKARVRVTCPVVVLAHVSLLVRALVHVAHLVVVKGIQLQLVAV